MKRLVNYFFITLAMACFCHTVFAMSPMERIRNRTAGHNHDQRATRVAARRDGHDGRTSTQSHGHPQLSSHHQPPRVSRAIAQPVTSSLDQFTEPGSFSASDFMSSFLEPSRVQTFSRGAKPCFLRGYIKIPRKQNQDKMPVFRFLFDGKEVMSDQNGMFCFPADFSYLDSYALVICSEVVKHFDKANTLRNIGIIPDRPYRYFRFHKNRITGEWDMQEKRLYKENFIVPEHAVIFRTDPDMVDYIEPWDLCLQDNSIKLPAICLKNVSQESLEKESARSLLSSLDEGSFHQDIRDEKREQPNKKIVVTLPG